MSPVQPRAHLTVAIVSAATILLGLAVVVATGMFGLSLTMVVVGVAVAVWSVYGIRRPQTLLGINTFYLAGLQSRETAIKWIRLHSWLGLFVSIVWTIYWVWDAVMTGA